VHASHGNPTEPPFDALRASERPLLEGSTVGDMDTDATISGENGEGQMHATLADLPIAKLEALRHEAAEHGDDDEMVETITGILGDEF